MNISRLEGLLLAKGLPVSIQERAMGVSNGTLNKLIRGKSKGCTLSTAFKICDYLGVDVNELRPVKGSILNEHW